VSLIERIGELRLLFSKVVSKCPGAEEFSSLLDEVSTRCASLISTLLDIYSIVDSELRNSMGRVPGLLDINEKLMAKFMEVLSNGGDLEDTVNRLPTHERPLFIDLLRLLRRRGLVDFDLSYSDGDIRIMVIPKSRLRQE